MEEELILGLPRASTWNNTERKRGLERARETYLEESQSIDRHRRGDALVTASQASEEKRCTQRKKPGLAEVESQRSEEENEEGFFAFLRSSILIWGDGLKYMGRGPEAQ